MRFEVRVMDSRGVRLLVAARVSLLLDKPLKGAFFFAKMSLTYAPLNLG
jgi:hypothetical protein